MIPIPSGVRVWIATGHTDMRRRMQSMALTVQESLKRDLMLAISTSSAGAAVISSRSCGMMGLGCRSTPSAWTVESSFGPRYRGQMAYMLEGIDCRNPQLI